MVKTLLFFSMISTLFGQIQIPSLTINSTNQSQYCKGGTVSQGTTVDGTASLVNLAAPYSSITYGLNVRCLVPASLLQNNPVVIVVVRLVEPNKTFIGQRTFRITVNGTISDIDLVKLTGGPTLPYEISFYSYVKDNLTISFNSTNGNALFSAIDILLPNAAVVAPPPTPAQ